VLMSARRLQAGEEALGLVSVALLALAGAEAFPIGSVLIVIFNRKIPESAPLTRSKVFHFVFYLLLMLSRSSSS
jgi:hypothetical protein